MISDKSIDIKADYHLPFLQDNPKSATVCISHGLGELDPQSS